MLLGIEYMYAFSTAVGPRAVVIIRFSEPDRAIEALSRHGLDVLDRVALLKGCQVLICRDMLQLLHYG